MMAMTESEDEKLKRLAKDKFERPLPKRFYKSVQVSDLLGITLDERPVKSPLKRPLVLPQRALAEAIAREWDAQVDVINPALMPLTKLANTALDRAVDERASVIGEIVNYAGNDMTCYWADRPPELVERQKAHWQPVLEWAERTFSSAPKRVIGLSHAVQPEAMLLACRKHVEQLDQWQLTLAYLLTTLTGSAFISLMFQSSHIAAEAAWSAANLEEDYQIGQWGEDWEAKIRREARRRDFEGLVHFHNLLR
jgi:chaperone required for assembly of F1-ATPase